MRILEILISIFAGYIFNYNIGISSFFILKGLFSNNYKISLFMLLNLFVYSFLGPSYIIFTKLYLMFIIGIFFHDKIMDFIMEDYEKKEENFSNTQLRFKNIYNKMLDLYNLINIVISMPFYIIYDNIVYLLESYGYNKKIMDNNLIDKLNKNYTMFKRISDYDTNNKLNLLDLDSLNKLDNLENYEDEELDNLLNNMLNPKNFMDMANDMRTSVGKKKLTNSEIEDKMKEFSPFLELFGSPFDSLMNETINNNGKNRKIKSK
jgi:hypothetical protein